MADCLGTSMGVHIMDRGVLNSEVRNREVPLYFKNTDKGTNCHNVSDSPKFYPYVLCITWKYKYVAIVLELAIVYWERIFFLFLLILVKDMTHFLTYVIANGLK